MKNIFSTKNFLTILVVVWIVFSIGYILRDQWNKFQTEKVQIAYQNGLSDAIKTIMKESEKCKPIPLYNGDSKVDMIAVSCLQQTKASVQQDKQK